MAALPLPQGSTDAVASAASAQTLGILGRPFRPSLEMCLGARFWWRLPASVRELLQKEGIQNVSSLRKLSMSSIIMKVLLHGGLKQFAQLIYMVKVATQPMDPRAEEIIKTSWEKHMMKVPSSMRPRSFHQTIALTITPPTVTTGTMMNPLAADSAVPLDSELGSTSRHASSQRRVARNYGRRSSSAASHCAENESRSGVARHSASVARRLTQTVGHDRSHCL